MSLPVHPPLTPIRQTSRGTGFAAAIAASAASEPSADLSAPLPPPLFGADTAEPPRRRDDAAQTDEDAHTNFDEELAAARAHTLPTRKDSSDAAAAATALTPTASAAQRKRAFEPTDAAATAATGGIMHAAGATGEETLAASASARSPSPPIPAAAATTAPAASGVAASSSSLSSSSRVAWPYYLVTAVAGAPNLAYASFVPRSKTFPKSPYSPAAFDFDDLPDADAAEWWGSGSSSSSTSATGENEASDAQKPATDEQKQAGAAGMVEDDSQTSKRARIASAAAAAASPNCTTSSPPHVSPRIAAATPAIPVDPRGVNVLSSYGQDSHFSLSNRALGCCVLGVADGVGGWRDNGVDSGEISRAIMKACRDIAIKQSWRAARGAAATPISRRTSPQMMQTSPAAAAAAQASAPFTLSPSDVLTRAYAQVKGSGEVEAGSTTACIVALTRVPITALAEFDAHRELEQRRITASAASAAAASAAIAAASTPRAIAAAPTPPAASASSSMSSFMSDIVSAVSQQSEQLIARVIGREEPPAVSSLASDSFTSMTDAEAEAEAESESAAGKENSMNHATSVPIAIPLQQPQASSPVMITIADSSPEPISVLPSAPPAASAASSSAAVAMEAEVPSNAQASSTATLTAPSSSLDEIYISAANLGDSGYIIFRREFGTTGNYRVITASDLQRAGRTVKQLAIIPSEYEHQQYCDDSPSEAMLDAHRVQEGDLIVLASDGLWDNLIASEWHYSFLYGWRQKEDLSPTSRKDRMCLVLEQIVATGASKAQEMRAAARAQAEEEAQDAAAAAAAAAAMTDASSAALDKSATAGACDELKESEAPISGRSAGSAPSSTASTSASASAFISASGSMASSRCASTSALSSVLLESAPATARGTASIVVGEGSMMESAGGVGTAPVASDAPMSDEGGMSMDDILALTTRGVSPPAVAAAASTPSATASALAAPAFSSAPLDWDLVEVEQVAEALKAFALRFMGSPDGKPDDLSIIAAKIMKEAQNKQ